VNGLQDGQCYSHPALQEHAMPSLEHRIDEMELRLAYQDKTISDLNDVITAQWKKIEALERQLLRLDEELRDIDSVEAPPNQKPPHY
jgi:SlyX protein